MNTAQMIYATIWRDLRWRMLVALPLVTLPAALLAINYAHQPIVAGAPTVTEYFDLAWFDLPGPTAIFLIVAVIVGAAGSLMRRRADLAYLFVLPVSRKRWVLSHVAASLLAMAALLVVADVIIAIGVWSAGKSVQLMPMVGRTVLVLVATGVWTCITLGVVALVRVPLLAVVLMFGVMSILPTRGRFQLQIPVEVHPKMLNAWDPWTLADPRAWQGGVPFASFATALALAVLGLVVAFYMVERYEP